MGVDRAIDITAKQRKIVTDLLERHLPNTTAWVYGSRAKWASRPQSDLDLVVFATPEQNGRVSDLRQAFEESNLPFRVDLFVWDTVPEQFRKHIKREHVVLVEREQREVESGWCEVTLDQLGRIVTGKTPPSSIQGAFGGDIPFVTPIDLDGRRMIASTARSLTEKGVKVVYNSRIPARSVMVSCIGSDMGKAAIAARECVTNQQINSIVVDSGDEPLFAYYNLSNRKAEIRAAAGGSAQPILNKSGFGQFDILLPPPNQQRAIAHILGTLDDKIELNRRMNETLEAMARALFKSWFVDFDPVRAKMAGRDTGLPQHLADLFPDRLVASELGEIPEGWKVGTLEDVASLNPESWSTRNAPEEIIYVDLSNTKWGYIEKVETYPWKAAPSRGRRVLRHGDTIVGTVRPGNGSFSLVGRDGLTGSTGFAVLRPKTPSDAELVWCAATSQDNIDRLAHLADGGAYPAVRPEAVAVTKFPLADFATRGAFSSVAASLLNEVDANKQQSHTLADLRDTLLPRLISGEWRAKQIEPESSISNISPDTTGVQA